MKEEGKGEHSNHIRKEVNRHREGHHEGLAAEINLKKKKTGAGPIPDSPMTYGISQEENT